MFSAATLKKNCLFLWLLQTRMFLQIWSTVQPKLSRNLSCLEYFYVSKILFYCGKEGIQKFGWILLYLADALLYCDVQFRQIVGNCWYRSEEYSMTVKGLCTSITKSIYVHCIWAKFLNIEVTWIFEHCLENNIELELSDSHERQVSLYEICQSQLKETTATATAKATLLYQKIFNTWP